MHCASLKVPPFSPHHASSSQIDIYAPGSRPFMTSPPTARKFAPLPTEEDLSNANAATLTQSRETGDLIPNPHFEDASIAKRAAPEAKPWAHFVAGG